MKLTTSTAAAAVAVIGAAGFFVGRLSSNSPADATTAADPATPLRSSSRATDAASPSRSNSRASTRTATRSTATDIPHGAEGLNHLETIVRGNNALERSRAMLAYVDQLAPEEFPAAVAHFRSLGMTQDRFGEYAILLTAWAQVDPTSALAYTTTNTRTGFATATVLAAWADKDPESAIRWAETKHTGKDANPYFAGIIGAIAATDPARATSLLTSMPRSQERGQALDAIMPQLLAQGPDAARKWLSGITDDSLRNGAMSRMADSLAQTDPKGTAEWLLANPGDAADRSLDNVFGSWARQDQTAAIGKFQTMPDGPARTNALRGIIAATASQDPKSAFSLLTRYPADVTDRTVQTLAWHSFGADPALAASSIARISDPKEQTKMYQRMLGSWVERDPATATAWIQNSPVPAAIKQQFLNPEGSGK